MCLSIAAMLDGLASKKWENMPRLSVGMSLNIMPKTQFRWPVSRVPIDPDAIQRFTLNSRAEQPAPKPKPVTTSKEAVPKSHRQIAYNMISKFNIPYSSITDSQFSQITSYSGKFNRWNRSGTSGARSKH